MNILNNYNFKIIDHYNRIINGNIGQQTYMEPTRCITDELGYKLDDCKLVQSMIDSNFSRISEIYTFIAPDSEDTNAPNSRYSNFLNNFKTVIRCDNNNVFIEREYLLRIGYLNMIKDKYVNIINKNISDKEKYDFLKIIFDNLKCIYIDYSTLDIWEQNFVAKTLRTIPLYIALKFAFNMNITDEFYIVDLICYALSNTKSTISSAGFNAENVNIKKELKNNISSIKEILIEANENSFNTLGISELALMNTLRNMIGARYKYQS